MSPKIDWSEQNESTPERSEMPAGIYHIEVANAEERQSASGNAYFSLRLEDLESGRTLCFDIIMLEGKGLRIGLAKLSRLGFKPGDDDELVAAQLIGRRGYVSVAEETWKEEKRLKVDISAKTSSCGYWSEEEPPQEFQTDNSEEKPPF